MTVTRVEKVAPPAALLRDADNPVLQGDTFRDVVTLAVRRGAALQRCQVDKVLLRRWVAAEMDAAADN